MKRREEMQRVGEKDSLEMERIEGMQRVGEKDILERWRQTERV